MKERPILFSGPMVRAILEGRKTQTRRVVKGLSEGIKCASAIPESDYQYRFTDFDGVTIDLRCPYGRPLEPPRDRLWVRETWGLAGARLVDPCLNYRADGEQIPINKHSTVGMGLWYLGGSPKSITTDQLLAPSLLKDGWRSSIHMPRWASRLTLEITSIRVEWLQEISEDDCWHEGVSIAKRVGGTGGYCAQFREGWNVLNAKRGYSWESNPWVWVIEFKRLEMGAAEAAA